MQAFLDAKAVIIADGPDLQRTLADLMNDPTRRADLPTRGLACIESHRGATARHAEMIIRVAKP